MLVNLFAGLGASSMNRSTGLDVFCACLIHLFTVCVLCEVMMFAPAIDWIELLFVNKLKSLD